MIRYLSSSNFVNRILQPSSFLRLDLRVFYPKYPNFLKSVKYSTSTKSDDKLDEKIQISYGPKDTLLLLGYNVREEDFKSHIKSLEESLKLKLMSLDFYSRDIAQSFSGTENFTQFLDLAMAQHQSLEFIHKAKENYFKSYEIWRKISGEDSREVANILCLLGVVCRDLGEIDSAKSFLLDSLSIDRKLNTAESNLCSIYSLNNLASISHLEQHYSQACEYYEEALRILLTATFGDENHRLISVLYYNLACSYYQIPDFYNALVSLNRSREIIRKIGDPCNISHKVDDLLDLIHSETPQT